VRPPQPESFPALHGSGLTIASVCKIAARAPAAFPAALENRRTGAKQLTFPLSHFRTLVESDKLRKAVTRSPIPYWLDTLLDIKRLAGKSGDHEADPFALLDLIADEVRTAINKATRQ
jgi:hypothetical protein